MYKLLGADQREYGPVPAHQVRQWIVERRLNAASFAQSEGSVGWKPLSEFPEFAGSLAASGPIAGVSAPGMQPLQGGTNGLAVASLAMGVLSVGMQFCCCFPIFSPIGIVFGIVALVQLKNRPHQAGKGMAWAGLLLSLFGLVIFGAMLLFGMLQNGTGWFQ